MGREEEQLRGKLYRDNLFLGSHLNKHLDMAKSNKFFFNDNDTFTGRISHVQELAERYMIQPLSFNWEIDIHETLKKLQRIEQGRFGTSFFSSDYPEIIEKQIPSSLSDYSITDKGIIEEQWSSVTHIPARLIEVNDKTVILECLIDIQNQVFENRTFDRSLLEGTIPLKANSLVLINMYKRSGEIRVKFVDGTNLVKLSDFEHKFFEGINLNSKRF